MSALTARAIASAVAGGADPWEIVAPLAARAATNPYNAFRHVDLASIEAQARQVDRAGPLAGVPVAIKDNLAEAGQPCGCASKILEGYRAPADAAVIERLRAAGAILLGRTNMDEFAMGSSTENSAYGPARNPLDERRAPGGSSGGSAVAVAAGITPVALGSETGGSVRQPAAFCGVVGFKPTYGRVSRRGLVAFASSLDVISPFGVDVCDTARITRVIAGVDPGDATTLATPVPDYEAAALAGAAEGLQGLRIGVVAEGEGEGIEPGVQAAMARAKAALIDAGAVLVPLSLPVIRQALACYYVIAPAEASSNLARFDGVRFGPRASERTLQELYVASRTQGFGPEVKRRILLGTFALSAGYADAYYNRALGVKARITADMEAALQSVDLLFLPTSPTVAFPLGARTSDPLAMYLADILTVPASIAGLPAISVPFGAAPAPDDPALSLPVGVQLIGRRDDDALVFRAAAALERRA